MVFAGGAVALHAACDHHVPQFLSAVVRPAWVLSELPRAPDHMAMPYAVRCPLRHCGCRCQQRVIRAPLRGLQGLMLMHACTLSLLAMPYTVAR